MNPFSWLKSLLTFDRAWREPFNRGFQASTQGGWDRAISEYGESIRINPGAAEAFFNRATCYSRKNDWKNTILDCTEVIRLNPKHFKAYHWRGVANRTEGNYEAAFADFTKAIEFRPGYPRAFYDRGLTYRLSSNLPNAIADFTQAIEGGLNAFAERGYVRAQSGDFNRASADLTEAIRRSPKVASFYVYRAWLFERQNKLLEAIVDLGEAIRLEPRNASHYTRRAFYYHSIGDYGDAIADDNQALKIDDRCVNAHNGLAWILATCPEEQYRDGALALGHALKAVEFGEGKNLAYIGTLAAAYAEVGNFEQAVSWARKFLQSNPPEENVEPARLRLSLYEQKKVYREEKGKLETVRAMEQSSDPVSTLA
jgi:tetratricopeptide (TPR) repeat protein